MYIKVWKSLSLQPFRISFMKAQIQAADQVFLSRITTHKFEVGCFMLVKETEGSETGESE